MHVHLFGIHEFQILVNPSGVRAADHGIAVFFQLCCRLLSCRAGNAATLADHALHKAFGQTAQLHQGQGVFALKGAVADLDGDLSGIDVLFLQALHHRPGDAGAVAEALSVG